MRKKIDDSIVAWGCWPANCLALPTDSEPRKGLYFCGL